MMIRMYGILAIVLVFLGEVLSITAELFSSKKIADGEGVVGVVIPMFALITLGGVFLVAGYTLGYLHFKDVWVITALSVSVIAIGEPLMAALLFGTAPGLGAAIGLVLGIAGMLAALLIR